jgi:ABC-2 type transport system permease protein
MNGRSVRIVAAREFRERARSRAFIVVTLVLSFLGILAVGGLVVVPRLLDDNAGDGHTVGLVDSDGLLREAVDGLDRPFWGTVHVRTYPDLRSARNAVRGGKVDIVLVGGRQVIVPDASWLGDPLVETVSRLSALHSAARKAALPPSQLKDLLDAPPVPVESLEPAEIEDLSRLIMANVGLVLLFFFLIFGSSGWLLTGVVEEKTSRVVELMISTVPPRLFLAGKLIGLGLLGLVQFAIITVPALLLALAVVTPYAFPSGWLAVAGLVVLWGALGYGFYAYCVAAVGSLISRMEDAQTAMLPVMLLLFASFYASQWALGAPETTAVKILSFFPPTTPGVMVARMAVGKAALWEVIIAAALLVVATVLVEKAAVRIYGVGVLHIGRRLRLRDAWRAAEG